MMAGLVAWRKGCRQAVVEVAQTHPAQWLASHPEALSFAQRPRPAFAEAKAGSAGGVLGIYREPGRALWE